MLDIVLSNKFKKDLRLAAKRGYNLNLLDEVVSLLVSRKTLPEKYEDHSLSGEYSGFRECHIKPDWLLITGLMEKT